MIDMELDQKQAMQECFRSLFLLGDVLMLDSKIGGWEAKETTDICSLAAGYSL